jgi:sulfur transfer complex TusBCD TusB component (DsrH family)
VRTVSLLLETEPSDQTLNRSLQSSAPNYDVVVLAYSGVVAVVNRSVQLEN